MQPASHLPATFAALAHPNYRLWFVGQLVSMAGTWMQTTALGFFVFELTRSSAWLGYVAFASGIASWMFTLYGGVVADRVSRRGMLVATQTAAMVLATVLAVFTFTGMVTPVLLLVFSFLLGVANAFEGPARQAFVLEMVSREDLTNAIALNSMIFNSATALGPAVGGLLYAWVGPGWCFSVNAASYLAVIIALLAMRLPPHARPSGRVAALAQVREGLAAIRADRRILALILSVAATTFFGVAFLTLLPAWAVRVLGGDATTNGYLQSARGVGALVAALAIASLGRARGRGRMAVVATLVLPAALFAITEVRGLAATLGVMVIIGVLLITFYSLANALVQSVVPDQVRGRVMSVYNLAFMGVMPLGSLALGALAHEVGEPLAGRVCAAMGLLLAAAITLAVPQVRRMS